MNKPSKEIIFRDAALTFLSDLGLLGQLGVLVIKCGVLGDVRLGVPAGDLDVLVMPLLKAAAHNGRSICFEYYIINLIKSNRSCNLGFWHNNFD